MTAQNPSDAGDDKTSGENLSFEELMSQRIQASQGQPEPEPEEAEETEEVEESEEVESEEETTEEVDEESEEEGDEESQSDIDLLSLSPEQIKELAKKGKSRLLERIGELTAKNKALEEKVSTIAEKTVREIPKESNPFGDIDSVEGVQAKYKELEETLETTDRILEEHEDYGPDDIIVVGNSEFTKRQVRKANRNAREAITKFLPAQHQEIVKGQQITSLTEQYNTAARKEVPEIEDAESEIGQNFQNMLSDPLVGRLRKEIPELGMQIEYILAHAAKSIFGKKSRLETGAGSKLKASPPSSPGGAGAAKSGKNTKVRAKEAYSRFEESGRVEDFVAARIAQLK